MTTAFTLKRKLFPFTVLFLLFLQAMFLPLAAYAGTLTVAVTLSTSSSYTPTNILITFTTINSVPAGGKININLPTDFVMETDFNYTDVDFTVNGTNRTLSSYTGEPPSGSDAIAPNNAGGYVLVQILLDSSGSGLAAGDAVTVKLGRNTSYQHTGDKQYTTGASGTKTFYVATRQSNNTEIDSGEKDVTIIAGAPEFSTIVYMTTLAGGAWIVLRKMREATI